MLFIVAGALGILFVVIMAGFPVAYLVSFRMGQEAYLRFPFLLAASLLFGFALSSFAAVISYGTLGIDTYPFVLGALILASWASFFILKRKWKFSLSIGFLKLDSLILVPSLWAFFLVRTNWVSLTEPVLRVGQGPDTGQNLMAALGTRALGSTWWSQANNINSFFGHSSLRDSVFDLYRYPSFRDQASFDYMVFGSRWGLSVPYSQIIRFFGVHTSLWETGIVLLVALLTMAMMVYGLFSLFSKISAAAMVTSFACISNAALLVQFFNGGLSQLWAISGMIGIFITLSLLIQRRRFEQPFRLLPIGVFGFASWLTLYSTYVDAAIILVLFICISLPVYYFLNREVFKDILKVIPISGLAVLLAAPVLTYATVITFDLRLRAATGTGIPSAIWSFPSELLGFVDVFSQTTILRSPETTLLGLFLTLSIFWQLAKKIPQRNLGSDFAALGIAGLATMLVGFILSYTGRLHTNYIYSKISVYVAPLVLIALIASLKTPKPNSSKKPTPKQIRTHKFSMAGYFSVLITIALITGASSFNATKNIVKQGTAIPYAYGALMEDAELQEQLSTYNYLLSYTAPANYVGVFANVHWISKAPNDIVLTDRLDIPLRLLCFSNDTNCKPTTQPIINQKLQMYGLIEYPSPFTTREFAALSPRDRFRVNFEAFGLPPTVIPERFIGGNPYYNE